MATSIYVPFNYSFFYLPFHIPLFDVLPGLLTQRKAENTNNRHPIAKTTLHENINYARKGRDGSVSAATGYGLDGPAIESHWGSEIFCPRPDFPRADPASYAMSTGSFLGLKRPGRGVVHPSPSNTEVKTRVELYLYCTVELFLYCTVELFLYCTVELFLY